jgi:hypothetical protein
MSTQAWMIAPARLASPSGTDGSVAASGTPYVLVPDDRTFRSALDAGLDPLRPSLAPHGPSGRMYKAGRLPAVRAWRWKHAFLNNRVTELVVFDHHGFTRIDELVVRAAARWARVRVTRRG